MMCVSSQRIEQKFVQQIPAHILVSPFLQGGGFGVFEGLVDPALQSHLLTEALACYPSAILSEVSKGDSENFRGGSPARRFSSVPGGPIQDSFYHSPQVLALLAQLTGVRLSPTGQHGTYSYYVRPGDHLELHRDVETCDLTLITCLHSRASAGAQGGTLYLYPRHLFAPLSVIRDNPVEGAVGLSLKVGQSLVFFGGIVPHYLSPTTLGQERIVSVLCYAT
jgi:hypothetical protein